MTKTFNAALLKRVSHHPSGPWHFLHFNATFGARRVESALSQACLTPDVTNRRGQGTLGSWPAAYFYSHSMVPGGFDVMSNTTLLTPFTSFTMRLLMRARTSYGTRAQSAVMASSLVTTRTATTLA
jgi:hypothetical protein